MNSAAVTTDPTPLKLTLNNLFLTPAMLEPVNNREPRTHISSQLRNAIGHRDNWSCWVCGVHGVRVLDHVQPRSSFASSDLHLADRSDNLRIICARCNGTKKNKTYRSEPPLPVVYFCGDDQWGDEWPEAFQTVAAFCDSCGCTRRVPTHWHIP